MFSKYDIEKELNKGINIVPFKKNNVKENSVNLTTSKHAWTISNGRVFIEKKNGNIYISNYNKTNDFKEYNFEKGDKCVIDDKYIILLPHSTTLIQTEEVIAVKGYIGGTYHSKVGLVSQGTGHIGTMLGPNFSGHSLIAIHNISETPLKLDVGTTFVSLVFHKLDTSLKSKNPTISGHLEKFSEWGITLSSEERTFLSEDWKASIDEVVEKMKDDEEFIKYKKIIKRNKNERLKNYINKRNFFILLCFICAIIIPYVFYKKMNSPLSLTSYIIKYYYQVGLSGIVVLLLSKLLEFIKKD